jgi:hypothetical protein
VEPALPGTRAADLGEAMMIFSPSALAMSRRIVCVMSTVVVLAGIAVGFTVALPGTSDSAGGEAYRSKPDFDLVFASLNAGSPREDIPEIAIAFDQVFASITPQPDDTPMNREKLRNTGWKRVLQKS